MSFIGPETPDHDGKIKRVTPQPSPGSERLVCTLFFEGVAPALGDVDMALEALSALFSMPQAPSLPGAASRRYAGELFATPHSDAGVPALAGLCAATNR